MPEFFAPRRPPSKKRERGQVVIYLAGEEYRKVRIAAAEADLTMTEFVRQCIRYALANRLTK